jgi:hypothetical protein
MTFLSRCFDAFFVSRASFLSQERTTTLLRTIMDHHSFFRTVMDHHSFFRTVMDHHSFFCVVIPDLIRDPGRMLEPKNLWLPDQVRDDG